MNYSYEEIEKKIDDSHNSEKEMWKWINLYIKKSKQNKNQETLLYAYRIASKSSNYPNSFKYADSTLMIGKKSNDKKLISYAYLNRGTIYMEAEKFSDALDDILLSSKFSEEIGDDYTYYKAKYYIAQNKIYLGLYEDANKELEKCVEYFKSKSNSNDPLGKSYSMYYLYSLMIYIDTNIKLGKQSENQKLINEAFKYIESKNLLVYKPYFTLLEGTGAFYKKNYKAAIDKLTESLTSYNDQWPHITDIYYLGLSFWHSGRKKVAIKYLEEIDNEYNKTKKLNPNFRTAYEILIKYNDSIGNTEKQLEYINKLMALDKSYEKNYKYLYNRINKEYDNQKLIDEKNKIEKSLNTQKITNLILLFVSILVVSIFFIRYRKLQNTYKKRFEEIIAQSDAKKLELKTNTIKTAVVENLEKENIQNEHKFEIELKEASFDYNYFNKIQGLNPNFVERILNQLEDFENENKFLDTQISQRLLSESFNTNATYLSKIINVYKGKTFNIYINDLRLDYILEFLKNDYKYLNMDIKELSRLSGFSNTENFSDNFQRKFKMKPSIFIKMMKENLDSNP
ncbi:hypothetical protein GCM10010992_02690 [Cloacibacterium rupense]|uniref:HTH araC/xylS-type domain-containing protein n=1 Tax=Cloacibacterium rupense TaxID=517423 RepID=A0ABQ2NEV8_9FLAO|nr:helix-turn-helix domain-containing protein [Cloacibacterium rupense]GGP01612.1 hypothetical protein GCM10010992_02690 [Cloacibacterium rupense]